MQAEATRRRSPRQSPGEVAILEAAVRLFSASSYDAVSMRGVAEAAGVSKANIYHHFSSKESLYQAILQSSAAELSGLVDQLAESPGPFANRLANFARAHLGHLEKNALTSRVIIREAFSGNDERSKMLTDQVFGGIFQRIISTFMAGQEAGELRPDLDPALCATLLIGADIFFFQANSLLQHVPQAGFINRPQQFSSEMVDVMLNGMFMPPGAKKK